MQPSVVVEQSRALARAGEHEAALAALAPLEGLPSPRLWLLRADLHREACDTEGALAALARAGELGLPEVARLRAAFLLPPIMGDEEAIATDRARMADALAGLEARPARVAEPHRALPWLDFYLAYHGGSDRPLKEAQVRALRAACPALTRDLCGPARPRGARPRVGFLSSHLRDHTIGRLNEALVEGLEAHGLQVVLLQVDPPGDPMAARLAGAVESHVLGRDPFAARQRVAGLRLDLLHYPDLGMDPFMTWLAFSRLAPVQTVSWGHPMTTGLDTLDGFVASEGLVPPGTEEAFTEPVLRLPDPMVCWRPPEPPEAVPREAFGLPAEGTVYLCPQSPFKLHPRFDRVLAGIAQADPDGCIALMAPRAAAWTRALRARLGRHLPDVDRRVVFLPGQPRHRYLALLAAADVLLDPFPFAGGHTSLEGLAVGTPIVTWPTHQLRGRITGTWYRAMGCEDLVAEGPEDYIDRAVRLGRDGALRQRVRTRIAARRDRIFHRTEAVAAHARLFHALIAGGLRQVA
jgi:protein O-GlcNAc transferase